MIFGGLEGSLPRKEKVICGSVNALWSTVQLKFNMVLTYVFLILKCFTYFEVHFPASSSNF